MERTTKLYFHSETIYRLTSLHRDERKVQNRMNETFEALLSDKIENENRHRNATKADKKFIDLLFDVNNRFTDEEKRDHVKATTFAVSCR
jgi:hypothetical protein